jgi:hypothetical protein
MAGLFDDIKPAAQGQGLFDDIPAQKPGMFDDIPQAAASAPEGDYDPVTGLPMAREVNAVRGTALGRIAEMAGKGAASGYGDEPLAGATQEDLPEKFQSRSMECRPMSSTARSRR